jgi:hypothetical protein
LGKNEYQLETKQCGAPIWDPTLLFFKDYLVKPTLVQSRDDEPNDPKLARFLAVDDVPGHM